MKPNFLRSGMVTVAALIAAGSIMAGSTMAIGQTAEPAPPPGPALDLINKQCSVCHSTADIFSQRKSPDDWAQTVDFMVERGAMLSPEETDKVIEYLATNFAPAPQGK